MRGRVIAAAVVRNDSVVPQLVRFAAVGAVSNVLYVAVFVLMQPEGRVIANVAGAAASTVLANELHRRLTFHAGERVHWFTAGSPSWVSWCPRRPSRRSRLPPRTRARSHPPCWWSR